MKLLLFDLDGTLVKSTLKIERNMLDRLYKLKENYKICLVSGGTYEKMLNQINKENECLFDYIFSESGVITYKNKELIHTNNIKNVLTEYLLQEIINFVLIYIANLDLPYKRGNFINFRKGSLYISPIGGDCSMEERTFFSEFDKINKIREKMVKILKKNFESYNIDIMIGGQIGLVIHPKGWDKTYVFKIINIEEYDEIFFFGDRCEPNGNDYPLYSHPKIKGYHVKDENHTLSLLESF